MSYRKRRMVWGSVLAAGIVAVVVGVFVDYYAIIVVQSGPYPAQSGGWLVTGFFFIGLGIGYMFCVPLIRRLEMKLGELGQLQVEHASVDCLWAV